MITVQPLTYRRIPWQSPAAVVVLALPMVLLLWLLMNPSSNPQLLVPLEHFVIVTNVSLVAAAVALLLARGALQIAQYRMLFPALGFMAMGGLFWVHALATPGIILSGYSYGGTVVGLSAFLSLLVPAILFSGRYLPLAARFDNRGPAEVRRWLAAITAILVAALVLYAVAGIQAHQMLEQLPLSGPPWSYVIAAITIALFLFAAWKETQSFRRSGLPMQGAMAFAFVLLAEAQVAMALGPFWTLAWWEYHILMFGAVVVALAALFVELDRRRGLERFLPTTIVERVLAGSAPRLTGERRVVTILFADMRGSTALAERLPAEEIVEVLNVYLSALTRCIFDHGGVLDKFTGDGMMATFGLHEGQRDGAVAAATSALAIRETVARLNEERSRSGAATARFGVGINTGEVTLGLVGIPQRADYMAIGDSVNTAARLESLCKQFGVDNVLSGETVARIRESGLEVQALGTVMVAGKTYPVDTYTLV